jgi:chemotaxis protein methyltransferase CheR
MTVHQPPRALSQPVGPLQLTDADFMVIAEIVHRDFGLHLPLNKKDLVVSRLGRRVKSLGLQDFASYARLLQSPAGEEEVQGLRTLLTTNVTRFFRENHQFTVLRDSVLPPLVARARAGGRVRLWSAGCSAGQEPYSLALTILDLCPEAPDLDLLILATDIDPEVLDQARAAIYPPDEADSIPASMQKHLVDRSPRPGGDFQIGDRARALVRIAELNLMRDWPMRGTLDVIFCRNVVIYFTPKDQTVLWQRFSAALPAGGHLFIGHSERLTGPASHDFDRLGNNVFRRTGSATGLAEQEEETTTWR